MGPETGEAKPEFSGAWRAAIIGAASLAFFLKIVIALRTYGTNDVYRYEAFALWSRDLGVGAYHYLWDLNHPPSVFHVLRVLLWITGTTHLPFQFWLRFPGILADAGSVWLVCLILRARLAEPGIAPAIVFFALSPAEIMISGFHGNTDPIVFFFVLLAICCARRFDSGWGAGAALALAMCCKVVPIILAPAFLLWLNGARRRAQFLISAALVTLVAWSPYLFQDPNVVMTHVFGYRSLSGIWGIPWLLARLTGVIPEYESIYIWYQRFGLWALFALLVGLTLAMSRSQARRDLFAQAGVIFLIFMTLVNGFSVQYLAWIAPWIVALGASVAGVYFATSSLFAFAAYNYWSEGLPWYLADSNRVGAWQGNVEILQLLCWLSVAATAWIAWKRIEAPEFSLRQPVRALIYAPAILAMGLTIHSATGQNFFRRSWEGSDKAAVAAIRANSRLDLSSRLASLGLHAKSIAEARAALAIKPGLPGAYDNIGAGDKALYNTEGFPTRVR